MATKLSIAGNTFLFTGKLTEFTREEAEAHVEAEGGKVLSGVSAKLNYLVVGEDAGSKLAKAEALGTVTILHEKEFLKIMNSNNKTNVNEIHGLEKTLDKDFIRRKKEFLTSLKKGKNASIALEFASKDLQADKEIVLAAVKQIPQVGYSSNSALSYASEDLRADKEIVLAAVKQNGFLLSFASQELKEDIEIVMAAVRDYASAIEFASENIKRNKDIILSAVNIDGDVLQFASKEILSDKEVVLAAIKNFGNSFQYASKELKADRDVILAACSSLNFNTINYPLEFAPKASQGDKEIVLTAVKQNGLALEYASKTLKADKDVVLTAVKQNGMSLEFASKALQGDKEVVKIATSNESRAIQFASIEFDGIEKSTNDDAHEIISIGKTENQTHCFFDNSKVNTKNIKKYAKLISLNELFLFENDSPLSKEASVYSSFDFSVLFNPKVLFVTFLSGFQGTLKITFSADPTDYIFEDFGRLNKNLHLSIYIGDNEMEIGLEREHFYDWEDIDDEKIKKKCEKIEKKDKSNMKWKTFTVNNLASKDFEQFNLQFQKHFLASDIWL